MAKEKNTEVATVVNRDTVVAKLGETDFNDAESVGKFLQTFENVDESELETISSDYQSLENGKKYGFMFYGLGKWNTPEKPNRPSVEKDCVQLVNTEGRRVINSDAVMVSTMRRYVDQGAKLPFPIQVKVVGEEEGNNGKYKLLEISVFA